MAVMVWQSTTLDIGGGTSGASSEQKGHKKYHNNNQAKIVLVNAINAI